MSYLYDQGRQEISMLHESAFRTPSGGSQDTAILTGTTTYPVMVIDGGANIDPPYRKKAPVFGIGAGKYPSMIVNLCKEPTTFTLSGPLQTGIFFAYAIGLATTAGSDPYTHTIAEYTDYRLESFTLHGEQRNITGAQDIIYDLFGCVVNQWSIEITRDLTIRENTEIMTANAEPNATAQTAPPGEFSDDGFTFADISICDFDINGVDVTPPEIDRLVFTIKNNVSMLPTPGDAAMTQPVSGIRDLTIDMHCWINSKDLYDTWLDTWSNSDGYYTNEAGRLDWEFKVARGADDYVHLKLYNLYIDSFSMHFSTADEAVKGVDITLKAGTPNSNKIQFTTAEVKDGRTNLYYHETT